MPDRRNALTPEALAMVDTIERMGSFAAAARELGKVPSALTYSVRQLEDALDVLLFDRSSGQAQLTEAGRELLSEGRRLLQEIDAVANRVKRVATGWETQLTIAIDAILAPAAIFDLMDAFYAVRVEPATAGKPAAAHASAAAAAGPPPTRLRIRSEVLSGTWEALVTGQADLALGVAGDALQGAGIQCEVLGDVKMLLAVAPHHPLAGEPDPISPETLARHRVVAIADTALTFAPLTFGVLPGQDVLTVPSTAAKLEALIRGLGCGALPESIVRRHAEAGRLVVKQTAVPRPGVRLHYAWRSAQRTGLALQWWLRQLESPVTRRALLEQHAGMLP